MTAVLPLTFVLASLPGCGTPDYGLAVHDDVGAELAWIETTDSTSIQISFDAAFQRTSYGHDIGRCQVQLAFLLEWEDDGMGSTEDGGHQQEEGQGDPHRNPKGPSGPSAHGELEVIIAEHGGELVLPENPGDCVLSIFDYDGTHHQDNHPEDQEEHPEGDPEHEEHPDGEENGEAPEGHEEHPEQEHDQGPSDGAWMVRGSIDLGPEILLTGVEDVWLDRAEDEEGRVFYQLQQCDEHTFPFAQTFDLEIPLGFETELGSVLVEEAFAIGPELTLTRPGYELTDQGALTHHQDQPLSIAWEIHDDAPEMNGEPVDEELLIWIQTQRREDQRFEEALVCQPFDNANHFLIPREFFLEMRGDDPGAEEPIYESSFQVDLRSRAQPAPVDWAELGRVSSTVTDGGIFRLVGPEEPPRD